MVFVTMKVFDSFRIWKILGVENQTKAKKMTTLFVLKKIVYSFAKPNRNY
jgi:hypothetical protein